MRDATTDKKSVFKMNDPAAKKRALRGLIIVVSAAAVIAIAFLIAVSVHKSKLEKTYPSDVVNYGGNTVYDRFIVPDGFTADSFAAGSSEYNYQHLELKKFGIGAYYSGGERNYAAPMWGVLKYHPAADKDEDLLACAAETGDVRPGRLVRISAEGNAGPQTGIIVNVCRDNGGHVKVIIMTGLSGREEPYVITSPCDSTTCWTDVDGTSVIL